MTLIAAFILKLHVEQLKTLCSKALSVQMYLHSSGNVKG